MLFIKTKTVGNCCRNYHQKWQREQGA